MRIIKYLLMRFIAYFDYLGFKDFITRNSPSDKKRIIGNNFRDIENALALGKFIRQPDGGVIADLSQSTLKCIVFSDTVLFYSKDDSLQSLKEILDVSLFYCSRCNTLFFPVRGCVYYGDFIDFNYNKPNTNLGAYHVNSVFGEALVNAHIKAEDQAWAGGVIDNSICSYLIENNIDVNQYLTPYGKLYPVPYKSKTNSMWIGCLKGLIGLKKQEKEWAIHIVETKGQRLIDLAYNNRKSDIIENFGKHNKRTDSKKVQRMITNTLRFLKSYK